MKLCFLTTIGISTFIKVINYIQGDFNNGNYLKSLKSILKEYKKKDKIKDYISGIKFAGFLESDRNRRDLNFHDETIINEIYKLLISDLSLPRKLSAELNSIYAYKKDFINNHTFSEGTCFNLIHTDTFIGELCCKVLKKFLENQEKVKVDPTKVKGLTIEARSMNRRGLYNYIFTLVERTNYYKDNHIPPYTIDQIKYIGTGGFKTQIPYTILSGIIFKNKIDIYYFHEILNKLLKLPSIPSFILDTRLIHRNIELIHEIERKGKLSRKKILSGWAENVEKSYFNFLFIPSEENESMYELSSIGKQFKDIYYKKFQDSKVKDIIEELKDDNRVFLIITTGTSLFTNALNYYLNNKKKLDKKSPLRKIITDYEINKDKFHTIVLYGLDYLEQFGVNQNKKTFINELKSFIRYSEDKNVLERTCAELNTLKNMKKRDYLNVDFVSGSYLHSDTYAGTICGKALAEYCSEIYGKDTFSSRTIKDLKYDLRKFKNSGIPNLIKTIFNLTLRKIVNSQTFICATGGFKAETAYVTMLGMILKTPVFYIHENQRNLVFIPPFPIILNYKKYEIYYDQFSQLEEGIEVEDFLKYCKKWENNRDKENMMLFIKKENNGYKLNNAGIIILQILRRHVESEEIKLMESLKSPDEKFHTKSKEPLDTNFKKMVYKFAENKFIDSILGGWTTNSSKTRIDDQPYFDEKINNWVISGQVTGKPHKKQDIVAIEFKLVTTAETNEQATFIYDQIKEIFEENL